MGHIPMIDLSALERMAAILDERSTEVRDLRNQGRFAEADAAESFYEVKAAGIAVHVHYLLTGEINLPNYFP